MSYIPGEDCGQAALLPAVIEDYGAADAPVRVIDAFVDGLDVRGLRFGRSVPAATGRPPYDPRDLLKLYLLFSSKEAAPEPPTLLLKQPHASRGASPTRPRGQPIDNQ